jgi:hypothetical protein
MLRETERERERKRKNSLGRFSPDPSGWAENKTPVCM